MSCSYSSVPLAVDGRRRARRRGDAELVHHLVRLAAAARRGATRRGRGRGGPTASWSTDARQRRRVSSESRSATRVVLGPAAVTVRDENASVSMSLSRDLERAAQHVAVRQAVHELADALRRVRRSCGLRSGPGRRPPSRPRPGSSARARRRSSRTRTPASADRRPPGRSSRWPCPSGCRTWSWPATWSAPAGEVVRRILREERDDAAEGVAAVERGARASHDLDRLQRVEVERELVHVERAEVELLGRLDPVDLRHDPVAADAADVEAVRADAREVRLDVDAGLEGDAGPRSSPAAAARSCSAPMTETVPGVSSTVEGLRVALTVTASRKRGLSASGAGEGVPASPGACGAGDGGAADWDHAEGVPARTTTS